MEENKTLNYLKSESTMLTHLHVSITIILLIILTHSIYSDQEKLDTIKQLENRLELAEVSGVNS
jgi:hypothetical protein